MHKEQEMNRKINLRKIIQWISTLIEIQTINYKYLVHLSSGILFFWSYDP
jgi:thiamine transporter ThiT